MKVAVDSETITVSTTPVGLTLEKLTKDITDVGVYCEGSIRLWTSGQIPTTTDGMPMYDGTERMMSRFEARSLKAVRNGSTDAKIHVQYYRCT